MSESAAAAETAPPCWLCGAAAARVVVCGYDRFRARPGAFAYARCAGCGLLARGPAPAAAELAGLYPDGYHDWIEATPRNLDRPVNRLAIAWFYGVASAARPRWWRAALRPLSARVLSGVLEPYGGNRLLDVGCGAGAALELYQRLGWRVQGVEPDARAAARARARGLAVHAGTLFELPDAARFDVVLLSHVLEHVPDPTALLARAAGCLAPGGKIVVRTPNARAVGLALYGSCWFPLDAPRHLCLFDPYTIRRLAQRAGLRAARVATRADPQLLSESRHYARTQGHALPDDVAARAARLARAAQAPRPSHWVRDAFTPLALLAAAVGRGELLEAELVR
jgi:2-polyprenyl-3-methyl-5-hydroxy-6-metoxy-1,4-benzoquinol methylase